jgi:hypothetical protein
MGERNSTSRDKLFSFFVVAKELRKVVKSQSEEFYSDPQRLLKLLKNNLPSEHLREIFLIIAPLKVNVIDLLSSTKDKKKLERKFSHTINKISSQSGYDEADAKWAVYTWAYALGRVPEKDYYEIFKLDPFPHDISAPVVSGSGPPIQAAEAAPAAEEVPSQVQGESGSGPPIQAAEAAPAAEEVPSQVQGESGLHTTTGVGFDNDNKPSRKPSKSSVFKNNKVRIPLAAVVVLIVISIIMLTTNSRDMQPPVTPTPVTSTPVIQTPVPQPTLVNIIGPNTLSAGDNATVAVSSNRTSDGAMAEYKWSYNVINGSDSESVTLQNGPKAEFQAPMSEKKYSLQLELLAKDENGSYNKVAEKTITVAPVEINIILDWISR